MNNGRDIGGEIGTSGATGAGTGAGTGTGTNGPGEEDEESWPERWLLPGETVLWRGSRASARLTGGDVAEAFPIIVSGLCFLFLLSQGVLGRHLLAWASAALPLAVLGGAVFRVLVLGPRRLRRRRYALTDRRLLIGSTRPSEPTLSWYRDQLAQPYVKTNADGTSDIGLGGLAALDVLRGPDRAATPRPPVLGSIAHPDLFLVLFSARPAPAPPTAPSGPDPAEKPQAEAVTAVGGWAPRPGERVLWTGRAVRLPWRFGTEERLSFWAGLALLAFILSFVADHPGAPWPILAGVAALFVFASHMVFGRLVWRRMRISRSTYVVTDQRIVAVWKIRRTVVTEADHRALRPPLVLADGSVFFAESRPPYTTMMWPPEEDNVRRVFDGRTRMRPAAVGEPPNFVGLAEPWTAARAAAEARDGAWSRPPEYGR